MPHAALWVVQPEKWNEAKDLLAVSMPHAALWVVQPGTHHVHFRSASCFNAARGFVGGATNMTPHDFTLYDGFNAARGFVGGATAMLFALVVIIWVSMPHAALWVVQRPLLPRKGLMDRTFQCRTRLCGWCNQSDGIFWNGGSWVSMPHAALWVVQQQHC